MIEMAKKKIDAQMLNSIYNKTIIDLAPFYYHYITTGQFPWFSILLKDKENHYGKLTEIEHDIFKSIKDLIIALKQYRLYHSNDTASLAWLQVSLFTWLAIPV